VKFGVEECTTSICSCTLNLATDQCTRGYESSHNFKVRSKLRYFGGFFCSTGATVCRERSRRNLGCSKSLFYGNMQHFTGIDEIKGLWAEPSCRLCSQSAMFPVSSFFLLYAMLARYMLSSCVHLSVCPSVHLSQSCPWVGLTHGLVWLGWVGYGSRILF